MRPRFLLDEHVNHAVQRQLRRLSMEIDVLAIGEGNAPAKGTLDPELLLWLEANEYILVTENRSTIPVHLADHFEQGWHTPGILWIRPDVGLGEIIEELYLIWQVSTADEYQDQALFIPL
jgi:hypothetical protein